MVEFFMQHFEWFASLLLSIPAYWLGVRKERKKRGRENSLDYSVEVHRFSPDSEPFSNDLINSLAPHLFEVIPNADPDTGAESCVMCNISSAAELHKERSYFSLLIRNSSSFNIQLLSFKMGSKKGCAIPNQYIYPKAAVLLALPSYGAPVQLVLNYNGTYLIYNINLGQGALRPEILDGKIS